MSRLFFIADTHFGHTNVIRYTGRPFVNSHEMDETMIERWNSVVGKKDTVYHLGDVGLRSPGHLRAILERLNGTIHLVLGNHDKVALKCVDRFASTSPLLELKVRDEDAPGKQQHIVLCHYSMRTWNRVMWGSWQLFGHSHGKMRVHPQSRTMDVGVDCADPFGTPFSYEQIKALMYAKTGKVPRSQGADGDRDEDGDE